MMDLDLTRTDLVTVEEIEFIQELNAYRFPNRVYQMYRHITRDNFNTEYQEAKKKIIRNIILGTEAPIIRGMEHKRVFYYGNLMIHINIEEKSICYIKNIRSNIDFEKKDVLSKMMGITSEELGVENE